jgi:hypothetical protein
MISILLFAVAFGEETRAQQRTAEEMNDLLVVDPLHAKGMAKAKWEAEAGKAHLRALTQAKLDAVREEYEAREAEFLVGRGTLDILLTTLQRLLESERAVSDKEADRVAALERYWERSKRIEIVNKVREEAGRIDRKQYLETKYIRLQAEIWLAEARAKQAKPPPLLARSLIQKDPLYTEELAKAKLDAVQANPQELAKAMFELAREAYQARYFNCVVGRGSLDLTLTASVRLLESERALTNTKAGQVAAFQRHWTRMKYMEDLWHRWYQVGRVVGQDYSQSRYFRLQAEIWLAQAGVKKGKPLGRVRESRGPLDVDNPLDAKELANAKFAAQADLKELVQAKLEADRVENEARYGEFLTGRGTLDILLGSSLRRLESELALSGTPADRVAAYERHWARMKQIEIINKGRFDRERISIQDYLQPRYFFLEAEIWLAQARTRDR